MVSQQIANLSYLTVVWVRVPVVPFIKIFDFYKKICYNIYVKYGVWLSLARAGALGASGRRFESCHPDWGG